MYDLQKLKQVLMVCLVCILISLLIELHIDIIDHTQVKSDWVSAMYQLKINLMISNICLYLITLLAGLYIVYKSVALLRKNKRI